MIVQQLSENATAEKKMPMTVTNTKATTSEGVQTAPRRQEDRRLPSGDTKHTLIDMDGSAATVNDERLDRRLHPNERLSWVLHNPMTAMTMDEATKLNREKHAACTAVNEFTIAKTKMR